MSQTKHDAEYPHEPGEGSDGPMYVCRHCETLYTGSSFNGECPALLRRALALAVEGEAKLAGQLAELSRWHMPKPDALWPEMSDGERRARNALSELKSALARLALGIESGSTHIGRQG